jgi:hypothetical protein
MFTRPDSSHVIPSTAQDMATVSKTCLTIVVGMVELSGRRQNLPAGSAPPRANKARDKVT